MPPSGRETQRAPLSRCKFGRCRHGSQYEQCRTERRQHGRLISCQSRTQTGQRKCVQERRSGGGEMVIATSFNPSTATSQPCRQSGGGHEHGGLPPNAFYSFTAYAQPPEFVSAAAVAAVAAGADPYSQLHQYANPLCIRDPYNARSDMYRNGQDALLQQLHQQAMDTSGMNAPHELIRNTNRRRRYTTSPCAGRQYSTVVFGCALGAAAKLAGTGAIPKPAVGLYARVPHHAWFATSPPDLADRPLDYRHHYTVLYKSQVVCPDRNSCVLDNWTAKAL
ncbi:unnamed protein product [Sphagnum balticum]